MSERKGSSWGILPWALTLPPLFHPHSGSEHSASLLRVRGPQCQSPFEAREAGQNKMQDSKDVTEVLLPRKYWEAPVG